MEPARAQFFVQTKRKLVEWLSQPLCWKLITGSADRQVYFYPQQRALSSKGSDICWNSCTWILCNIVWWFIVRNTYWKQSPTDAAAQFWRKQRRKNIKSSFTALKERYLMDEFAEKICDEHCSVSFFTWFSLKINFSPKPRIWKMEFNEYDKMYFEVELLHYKKKVIHLTKIIPV